MNGAVIPFGGALSIPTMPARRWMKPRSPAPEEWQNLAIWVGSLTISLAGHVALFGGIQGLINAVFY